MVAIDFQRLVLEVDVRRTDRPPDALLPLDLRFGGRMSQALFSTMYSTLRLSFFFFIVPVRDIAAILRQYRHKNDNCRDIFLGTVLVQSLRNT